MIRARIAGIGFHVPERVVTNADLEKLMDTSDSWIVERTGIRQRRFVDPPMGSSDLGLEAAKQALADAGREAKDVDFILFATTTPDYVAPGNGPLIQDRLGIGPVASLNVSNACSGFVYSLAVADSFVRTGQARCVLVIGAEVQSTGLNLTTAGRDVAVLFADGAGAAVVVPDESGAGILASALHSEGAYARELMVEAPTSREAGRITHEMLEQGRNYPSMNGRMVFKHATTRFPEVIAEVLGKAGRSLEQVKLVVPHQANRRIGDAVVERLGLPPERVFQNIERYGNTTAASIPIALTEARNAGLFQRGDLVVLAAFGAGFAWGATAIEW